MKNLTKRPYKLVCNDRKGLKMCYKCGHFYQRQELFQSCKGLECVFCKGVKISEGLKAPIESRILEVHGDNDEQENSKNHPGNVR
jgi:hypothetical protein